MPVEEWRKLLEGKKVILCAGLELNTQPYPGAKQQLNTIETVRGAATSLLSRGADRIYLFNYMDSETCMDGMDNYPHLLREIGSPERMEGKERRHIITYPDTWAPGEPRAIALPAPCGSSQTAAFRIHIGPKPSSGKAMAVISIEDKIFDQSKEIQLRVNGCLCKGIGLVDMPNPKPETPAQGFDVPASALHSGCNVLEVTCSKDTKIVWAELMLNRI
jgi:hypothetical protein